MALVDAVVDCVRYYLHIMFLARQSILTRLGVVNRIPVFIPRQPVFGYFESFVFAALHYVKDVDRALGAVRTVSPTTLTLNDVYAIFPVLWPMLVAALIMCSITFFGPRRNTMTAAVCAAIVFTLIPLVNDFDPVPILHKLHLGSNASLLDVPYAVLHGVYVIPRDAISGILKGISAVFHHIMFTACGGFSNFHPDGALLDNHVVRRCGVEVLYIEGLAYPDYLADVMPIFADGVYGYPHGVPIYPYVYDGVDFGALARTAVGCVTRVFEHAKHLELDVHDVARFAVRFVALAVAGQVGTMLHVVARWTLWAIKIAISAVYKLLRTLISASWTVIKACFRLFRFRATSTAADAQGAPVVGQVSPEDAECCTIDADEVDNIEHTDTANNSNNIHSPHSPSLPLGREDAGSDAMSAQGSDSQSVNGSDTSDDSSTTLTNVKPAYETEGKKDSESHGSADEPPTHPATQEASTAPSTINISTDAILLSNTAPPVIASSSPSTEYPPQHEEPPCPHTTERAEEQDLPTVSPSEDSNPVPATPQPVMVSSPVSTEYPPQPAEPTNEDMTVNVKPAVSSSEDFKQDPAIRQPVTASSIVSTEYPSQPAVAHGHEKQHGLAVPSSEDSKQVPEISQLVIASSSESTDYSSQPEETSSHGTTERVATDHEEQDVSPLANLHMLAAAAATVAVTTPSLDYEPTDRDTTTRVPAERNEERDVYTASSHDDAFPSDPAAADPEDASSHLATEPSKSDVPAERNIGGLSTLATSCDDFEASNPAAADPEDAWSRPATEPEYTPGPSPVLGDEGLLKDVSSTANVDTVDTRALIFLETIMRNRLCSKCAHDADQFFQTVPFAYRLGFFGALESHGIFGKPTFTTRLLGLGLAWAHGGDDALAQWRDGFALGQEYAPVYIHVHREGAADHEEEEFGVVPVLHAYAYTILYGLFEAGGGQPFNQHESDIAEAVGLNDAFGPHNANFTGDDLRRFCDVYSGRPCARSLLEHAVVNSIKYFMANSDEAQEAADSTDIQRMPEAVYHAIHAFVQDCSDDANAVDQLLASDGEQRIEPDWGNAIPEATCRTDEIPDDPDVSTSPPDALTLSAASAWEVGEDDDNAAFLEPIMDHFLEPVISPLLGELAIFMLGASADYKDGFCDGFLVRSDMQQDDTIIFHAMRATPLDDGLRTMDYIHGYQFGSAFAVTVREMKQPGSKLSSQPFTIAKWTRYLTFELSGTFCYGSEGEQIGAIHMEMDISIWHDAFKHIAQAARYHLEKCHKEYCEGLLGEPDNRVMEWTAVELAVMNALRESVSKAPLDTSTCDQRVYEVAHGFLAPNLRKNGVEDVFRNLEKEKERAGVAQKTTSPPTLASLKAVPSISSISPASPTPSASTSLSATAPVFTPSSAFTSASIAAAALATPPSSTSSTPSSSPPPPTYTPAPQFTTIHAYAAAGSGVSRMLDSHPDNAAFLDKLVRCEAFGIKGLADGMNAAYARCEDAPSTSHGGLYLDAWELGWWMMTTREEDKVEKIWDSERWMTVFEIGIAHYTRRFDTALLRTTDERWNLEDQKDSTYLPLDDILYCFYIKVLSSEGNPDRRRRGQVPAKNVWNPQCRTVFCAVFDALQDIRQSSPGFMRSHQPYRGRSVLYDIVRDRVHAHRNKDHSLFVYSSRRGRPSWM